MKKLFAQIVKFGIVGFIRLGIDYVTGLIVLNLVMALTSSSYFEAASLIGSIAGFTVSVIANYILSFKFVFERKEDMNKKVEFITFVVLSLIGMLLNSFLIWIVVGPIYGGNVALQQNIGHNLIYTIAKVRCVSETDCSQCIRSDISANDNRVCHVVELLENVSDNQRQRKLQNDRKRTSLCHVFFHEKTSSK